MIDLTRAYIELQGQSDYSILKRNLLQNHSALSLFSKVELADEKKILEINKLEKQKKNIKDKM